MKKLFLIFYLIFALSSQSFGYENDEVHKVLKIVDGDTFYIDFNNNGKAEKTERVRVNGIDAFETVPGKYLTAQMKKYNLSEQEALGMGYLGKEFAKKTLLNKYVTAKSTAETANDKNERRLMSIYYGPNKNYEQEFLKAGLGVVYAKSNLAGELKQYRNQEKFEENVKKAEKLDLVILNKKNGKYHKPSCEYGQTAYQRELIRKPIFRYTPAGCCFKKLSKKKYNNVGYVQRLKEENFIKTLENKKIILYFVDPVNKKHPVNKPINNVEKSLEAIIDSAQISIDMATYGISGRKDIINALRRAKERGVIIRGVVDDYGTSLYPDTKNVIKEFGFKTDVFVPIAQKEFNEKFTRSQSALMHNKFVVVDNKYLWTGSTNITDSCMTFNSNSSVVIYSPELAQIYSQEFAQMYEEDKFHVLKDVISNKSKIKIKDDVTVSVLFSPKDKAISNGVLPLIQNSEKSICISMFYLTNYWISDELIKAKNRGVDIHIIVDETLMKEPKNQVNKLRASAIPVKIENWKGKMHQKSAVFDNKYSIIASTNWTGASEFANDENMLIIENEDIAKQMTKEFFRLWKSIR